MLLRDQIVQQIRLDMRELTLNRKQFDIGREQILSSSIQVEQAEDALLLPSEGGTPVTLNLLTALNTLLAARNGLIANWVSYETNRLTLNSDFDLMDIDGNGVWTNENDPGTIATALRLATEAPSLSLAIPARIPDLSGERTARQGLLLRRPSPATGSSPTSRPPTRETSPPPTSRTGPAFQPSPTEPPLSPQPLPAPSPRPRGRRLPRIPGRLLGLLAGMGIVGAIGYLGILPAWSGSGATDKPLLAIAKKATLSITVSERGNVESQVTVDGICELNGSQNKISYLVPEGTKVKKGDVVCKFDGSEIEKHIAEQEIKVKQAVARIETTQQEMEIQRNKGESDVIAAKVELTLAQLDLEKYQKGDYPAEYTKAEGEMELKKKDVEAESAKLEQYKALLKKGFKTPEDIRIQTSMLAAKELDYSSSKQFLEVKEKYEYKRKSTEFSSKADQNQKKVEQSAGDRQGPGVQGDRRTTMRPRRPPTSSSPQLKEYVKPEGEDGHEGRAGRHRRVRNDRYWDASSQVREGATVYSRQKIFSLPDMTRMQVKVNIHESLIKKIKAGQKAEVRIDAFPNVVFVGTVKSVSQLADSSRPWMSGGVKEYTTIVTLNDISGYELKPGMTAEARILVGELKNVLVVPVQAVAENKGDFYAFVDEPGGIKLRKVKVGENNEKLVEILDGLKEGESVALDARIRAAAEFKSDDAKEAPRKDPRARRPSPQVK